MLRLILIMSLAVCETLTQTAAAALNFTYFDQDAWARLPGSQCDGARQSPIDLDFRYTDPYIGLGHQLTCSWQRYDAPISGRLTNIGHTLELEIETPHFCQGIPGLPLTRQFRLAKLHVHFGVDHRGGSEHTINGRRSALELHMVHFDTRFGSMELAARQPHGIMVTAILFDKFKEGLANSELSKFGLVTGALLRRVGSEADFQLLARNLISGTGLDRARAMFLTYTGSLTTPACNEVVTWIVAAERGYVGSQTLALLRTAESAEGGLMAPNYRALQPLHGRRIMSSFAM